jgi:DNA primase small subunit
MDPNSRFLLRCFRKYYKGNRMPMPSRYARREFGFMFFDRDFVQRHIGFNRPEDLQRYMMANVPSHSYYSTAYYRTPSAPTMEEKDWLGADLIFDLDADHLAGADKMTYLEMMDAIRKQMLTLIDSFLFDDLGFRENQVSIVFSGGRGYHAHIEVPSVLELGTHERREIVDYITSTGMDMDWVFPFSKVVTSSVTINGQTRSNVSHFRMIPGADSGGWRLRMRNGLKDVVDDICDMDNKELKKTYPSIKDTASRSIDGYRTDLSVSRTLIFENNKMGTLKKGTQDFMMKIMTEDMAKRLAGEIDEPVTADVKRLIRLPGSVHGKSGLKVMPLTVTELKDFNPLTMAVPDEYSNDDVTVTMHRDYEFSMKDQNFKLSGTTKVPEYAAVFLVGKKLADYGDGTKQADDFF